MKTRVNRRQLISASVPFLCSALVLAFSSAAMAATPGSTGTPWDSSLTTLTGFLTGSVARYISIIAIFVAGLALVFGEDLGQFARRLLMIVIAIAFLVGASSFATAFIGTGSGAVL